MKLLAASMPWAALTFIPGGSRPVIGSNIMAVIHFSLLKVTWEIMLNPPHNFSRKKGRYSGDVDQDSNPCSRITELLLRSWLSSLKKKRSTYGGYDPRDQDDGKVGSETSVFRSLTDLKLSPITAQLPHVRNAIANLTPFSFYD
jgi:hypothetical protein